MANELPAGLNYSAATNPANNILGMTPANFATIFGLIGSALAPKDSAASRLGQVAAQFGKGDITSMAAQVQDAKNREFLTQLIGGGNRNKPGSILDNTPESFYGGLGALGQPHEKEITIKTKPLISESI